MTVTPDPSSEPSGLLTDGPPQWLIVAVLAVAALMLLSLLWLSTAEWRHDRKVKRQWRRMTDDQRRAMRTRFVATLFDESGGMPDPVRVSLIEKHARLGFQRDRIIDNLIESEWIKKSNIRGGLLRTVAAFFNPSVRGSHDAVRLTASGVRTLRKMAKSGVDDLQVGDMPDTVVTVDGKVINVENIENYFNAPVSNPQFNHNSPNAIQINGQDAERIATQIQQAFSDHLSPASVEQLRQAVVADGSSQAADEDASHTQRWIDAIKEEVPTATVVAITATLKHLLGTT